jgi:hypothetical protein
MHLWWLVLQRRLLHGLLLQKLFERVPLLQHLQGRRVGQTRHMM